MSKEKTKYIHETNSIYCTDGELHISYGNHKDEKYLVFNVEQLYKDLPFIVSQVIKENKKMQEMYLESIKESLEEL
tara:strand:- start:72 stop:299 length:228 start_codon:yes stop_codon:yes gene_type:complete